MTPAVLARRLLRSFLDQVLMDGLFHADPHPGNIFVDAHGTLWFLDFGAVGHLDPMVLEAMQEMAIGFQLRDPVVLARALQRLAGSDDTPDSRALEGDIGVLLAEALGSGGFDPQALGLMLDVMQRHGLQAPRAMTVLSRALLTMEGTLRTIDSQFSLTRAADELLPELAGRQEGAAKQQLEKELVRALPVLRTLPGHFEGIAAQLRSGRLAVRVERFAGADRSIVGGWIDRIVFAAIGMFGLVASAVLLVSAELASNEDTRGVLELIGFAGIIMSAVMLLRSVARIVRAEIPSGDSG